MTIQVSSDAAIRREVWEVLRQHMSPSKLARFWAEWESGHGDYLHWRDEVFAGQTVDELFTAITGYEADRAQEER